MKALAVCLAGPTASGKSAVAMALAEQVPLEIISVDSAQVYRDMDIGTAKPSASERARVRHHLIDILEPTQSYSAARFVVDARRLIEQIQGRGHLPLLVGGTMLYFKALFSGLAEMPGADVQVRKALDAEAALRGWPALHAELSRIDPATAARLAPADSQRIQRALEVWRLSGRTLSDWHAQPGPASAGMALPLVSLEPRDRSWLHTRIAARFDAMRAAGLLAETRALRARAYMHAELPSMRCVGYRQAWAALDAGHERIWPELAVAATRQLAKRQLTWLRGMPTRTVVACDAADALPQALNALRAAAGVPA